MPTVSFTLNGRPVTVDADTPVSLLHALRDRLGVTSPKDGCSPQGQCGACTVIVNGKAVMSCVRDVWALEGANVVTLEGVEPRRREVLARAFVEVAGLQCGYCIPGIAIKAAELLDRKPSPSEEEIRVALTPHLCRCTGYVKIVEAVKVAARHWAGDTLPAVPDTVRVGEGAARYDGLATALGERPFVDDLRPEGLLYGAVRLADHPRAVVRRVDVAAAAAMPGVRAILTAAELPAVRRVGLIEHDWPVMVGEGEVTHCVGDVLAIVAADTREQARLAAAAVAVEYDVLAPVTDPDAALAPGAPEVHPGRANLLSRSVVRRGDVDAALAASAHVITETFRTQCVEHAFLEVESCVAIPQVDGLRVYTQGQGVHDDRKQIAAILGWDPARVDVTLVPNGGAFGGKEDLTVQGHASLLAVRTGRPVKLTLTREQSMRMHPKRHPIRMTYTVGCDAKGRLTAVRARMIGDKGAYASVGAKVLERAAGHSCGPYRVPAVDVIADAVYTNNLPNGAFRGFGANQAAFAIEGMLDRLAERVGLDGYDIRERNVLDVGDAFATGQVMNAGCGIRQTLEAVRDVYKSARHAGIACGVKNTGIGNGMADVGRALIRVDAPDRLTIFTGYTEMGQGLFTICRQIACDELGLGPEQVRVEVSTRYAVECGMTTASRATLLCSEAVHRACERVKAAGPIADLVGESFLGEVVFDFTTKPEDGGDTHVAFSYATQVVLLDDAGRLKKVVAAHDVGRVMNRATCEGQLEGAVHMGLGFALTESLPQVGGHPASVELNDLRILRARHVPEIEIRLLEVRDPLTHYGVKGVGEVGLVPTAGAVASALRRYDGVWRTTLPMRGSAAARAILPSRLHEPDHP
ncbi:MAG: selenium-dependent xanthine dehydrogenase [Myxococcota bacterium]